MLEKSKSTTSTMPSSKFTTQLNLSKCTLNNGNPLEIADDTDVDGQFKFWPPTTAMVDRLVLKLKAKDGDTEANWEKIMLSFKKELDAEDQFKPRLLTSDVIINSGSGDGMEKVGGDRARAKFSVPLSRREMEKDFEDMGERRLPRKPKKRPKSVQNQLDNVDYILDGKEMVAEHLQIPSIVLKNVRGMGISKVVRRINQSSL